MQNDNINVIHTVRKDQDGKPLKNVFTMNIWKAIQKQQKGNYPKQGVWKLDLKTVSTPPEAATKKAAPKKSPGRPKKS